MYNNDGEYISPHYTCCSSALVFDIEEIKRAYRDAARELMRRQKEKLKMSGREDLALSDDEINMFICRL